MSKIKDSVVVITGASSGIGRATALNFAKKGANLVLAARGEQALNQVAADCEKLGVQALAVPTDVSDQSQVEELARRSVEKFGRIDVWVNDAGVYMLGRFEQTPIEDYKRVIEINLYSCIYGARAVLPIFRNQNSGVLINVSSILGKVPQAYTSAYDISKFGVRALGSSLRQELLLDKQKNIKVCTVMPGPIDTPLFAHTANYTGRVARPPEPVYAPETVAATILKLAQHPRKEVYAGKVAGLAFSIQYKLAPGLTEKMVAVYTEKLHFINKPTPVTPGNLYHSQYSESEVKGGWQKPPSAVRRLAAVGAVAATSVGLAALLRSRKH